jgi:putative radical SAM enzyme (TIGR03279 family)
MLVARLAAGYLDYLCILPLSGRLDGRPVVQEDMIRIAEILPGTIASELQLEIGSRIIRINGESVRDTIDFRFLEADGTLEVEIVPASGGTATIFEIEKDPGEALGVIPAADAVRECANKCVFCFVDGNPEGVRRTLNLRDDDFRLSFTYGNYVTLTNLGPRGFQRLIDQRLSPLYVSVHATEPAIRERILGVPRGGDILEQLRRLTEAGLEVHTQVVLCPEWNDGSHLERTIEDLWGLGPGVLSLSVVPVGLTKYNLGRPVRLLTPTEAGKAVMRVEAARRRALEERGTGWAYVGDEMFFIADMMIPPASYYDDWPLTENGVGSVRQLLDDFAAGLPRLPRLDGQRIGIATGTRMASVLNDLGPEIEGATGAIVEVIPVPNRLYGESVNTAGLLPGADFIDALTRHDPFDIILLPGESLNDDDRFIDDLPLTDLVRALAPAQVLPGHEITSTLAAL